MDSSKKDPQEDFNCIVKLKGDNKYAMNDTTSIICKYDSTKVKENPDGRASNSLHHCMNFVSKWDPKKTIKVKDSKNDKKDKKN